MEVYLTACARTSSLKHSLTPPAHSAWAETKGQLGGTRRALSGAATSRCECITVKPTPYSSPQVKRSPQLRAVRSLNVSQFLHWRCVSWISCLRRAVWPNQGTGSDADTTNRSSRVYLCLGAAFTSHVLESGPHNSLAEPAANSPQGPSSPRKRITNAVETDNLGKTRAAKSSTCRKRRRSCLF